MQLRIIGCLAVLLSGCTTFTTTYQEERIAGTEWRPTGGPSLSVSYIGCPEPFHPTFEVTRQQREEEFKKVEIVNVIRTETIIVDDTKPIQYVVGDVLMLRLVFFPTPLIPVDLVLRLFGGGVFHELDEVRNPPALEDDYFLNILDWVTWFIPFYPVAARDYSREITERVDPNRTRYEPTGETRMVNSGKIVPSNYVHGLAWHADGHAVDKLSDMLENEVKLDLEEYLLTRNAADVVHLEVRDMGKIFLAKEVPASDLGVTWAVPKLIAGNPPRLGVRLALVDADKDRFLEAGESAKATLIVENVGDVTAWDLRTNWETPPSSPDRLRVGVAPSTSRERLDPGEIWESVVELQAAPEWTWDGKVTISARAEELSGKEHPKAVAEIATRAFDPPQLKLARFTWSDGNNGIIEQGDRLNLRLWTQNIGLGEAKGVHAVLESLDSALRVSEAFPDEAHLEPSELKEFVWNLAIPEGWTPSESMSNKGLPINVVIKEARPRFSVPAEPLGLALGDRTVIETSGHEATELAELQRVAKEAIAEARKTKALQAELEIQRQQAEKRQRELAVLMAGQKKVEEEELRKKEELERRGREREEARRRAQTERNLLRKCSYAVIVGINSYDDPAIGDLRYAEADARAIRNALTDEKTGLFAPENVILLTTDAQDPHLIPTRLNVFQALTNMNERLSSEDRVLFFFAGHGTTDENSDDTYLLPKDATLSTARFQGLGLKEDLLEILESCPAQKKIIIVDACHSGLRKDAREARDLELVSTRIQTALEAFTNRGAGRVVFTSSSRDQISHEDEDFGHGVFTNYLVEGLKSLASRPTSEVDQDLNGRIEAGELFEYVSRRVESWCTAKRRGLQTPRSSYDDAGASIALAATPQEE